MPGDGSLFYIHELNHPRAIGIVHLYIIEFAYSAGALRTSEHMTIFVEHAYGVGANSCIPLEAHIDEIRGIPIQEIQNTG